jgi:hypothetical protein
MSRRAHTAEPPLRAVAAPSTAFRVGDRVVITDGQAKGCTGVVVASWPAIGGIPSWRIDREDCRDCVLREDFLKKVG